MPIDKEIIGQVIDQSSGVIEKAYDDLAHPTAKSLGNTLSLLPRTVGVWLGKWEKWVINGEESIRLTAEAVREKAEKIPEENLTEPEPYVAVPAIQQLSYCYNSEQLRSLYANLLVSSMNKDTKSEVHPAFSNIIQQLAPIDVIVLETMKRYQSPLSIVTIRLNFESKSFHELVRDYSYDLKNIFDNHTMHCATLQNLHRLGLINLRYDQKVKPDERYNVYKNDNIYKMFEQDIAGKTGMRISLHEGLIELTDFGRSFCKVCCD